MEQEERAAARNALARKRAAILRRHSALSAPTPAENAACASELGVSVIRFHHIVRAWKLHGQDALNPRSAKLDHSRVRAAIEAADGELDMEGVPPANRKEVERRIRLVGRYLRLGKVRQSKTLEFAAEYGASYATFRTSVTAWLLTPKPAAFPNGKTTGPARIAKIHENGVSIETIVGRAIDELGPSHGATAVHRRVAEMCHSAKLRPPSLSLVSARLIAAKGVPPSSRPQDEALRLDRITIDLADHGGVGRKAVMTIIFGAVSGRIHAYSVLPAEPEARSDAAVLAEYIRRQQNDGDTALLEWSLPKGPTWDALAAILAEAGTTTWSSRGRLMQSAKLAFASFGDAIGDLRVGRVDKRSLLKLEPDRALSAASIAFVDQEVDRHNARRPAPTPPLVAEAGRAKILERLGLIAG